MSSVAAARERMYGFYPERKVEREPWLDRFMTNVVGHVRRGLQAGSGRYRFIVRKVQWHGETIDGLSETELRESARRLREELRTHGLDSDRVAQSFALVRRVSELRLGLRHYDVQLIGGWILLGGMIAEMETGEGKTLAATLPACTAALAGIPVHVVTVNDFLARRDADWMRPVYEGLGLTVGVVTQESGLEERREAYACDIVYCANKVIVFDYLRDLLALKQRPGPIQVRLDRLQHQRSRVDRLRLRGLVFAIVDEADSVLIDEARTPLIISGRGDSSFESELYGKALELADELEAGTDYKLDLVERSLTLKDAGKDHLADLAEPLGGLWAGKRRREELVRQALVAQRLFHRDKHYLVKDGKVQIIDEYTGRLMPDRNWEQGLHQLIEAKEDCEITTVNETLARISYQRFFRRYLSLAGMTGTAREAAPELWSVYRLRVVAVPTHKPVRRRSLAPRIFATAREKWTAVVERIRELHRRGQPVLVGTRSVADSEHLSDLLSGFDLPHRVLNARQDDEEAQTIAEAGQPGRITVATNMAGRGQDIVLGDGVVEQGGLHVIATERHDAHRIDRQLFGRGGRQGDAGSFEMITSLEDELITTYLGERRTAFLVTLLDPNSLVGSELWRLLFAYAQSRAQRQHFLARRDLLKLDENVARSLAFAGKSE